MRRAWLAGISAVVIAACSSSSSSNGSSSGGVDGGGDDASSDAGGGGDATPDDSGGHFDAGPCGAGTNIGTNVDVQQMASDAPAAMGGAITDGAYVLSSGTLYTGAGGATGPLGLTLKQTWHFIGTTYSHVSFDNTSNTETRQGGTYMMTSTIDLHLIQTCPEEDIQADEFTATPTSVTLYSTDASGTLALVLTRQ